jgi:hypothetical protein
MNGGRRGKFQTNFGGIGDAINIRIRRHSKAQPQRCYHSENGATRNILEFFTRRKFKWFYDRILSRCNAAFDTGCFDATNPPFVYPILVSQKL